jgi:hypothetical protein
VTAPFDLQRLRGDLERVVAMTPSERSDLKVVEEEKKGRLTSDIPPPAPSSVTEANLKVFGCDGPI